MDDAKAPSILDYFRGTASTLDCGAAPGATGG
jgi:hypothetical protein